MKHRIAKSDGSTETRIRMVRDGNTIHRYTDSGRGSSMPCVSTTYRSVAEAKAAMNAGR